MPSLSSQSDEFDIQETDVMNRWRDKLGEILRDMEKNPGTLKKGSVVEHDDRGDLPTLSEMGISKVIKGIGRA